jgi:hypothetical protein
MSQPFRLLMIGAMYENGGNTAHRFLDGHPDLFVYPFESQLGTRHVADGLASMFPLKYRWPEFLLDATAIQDFRAIIDEETKVRARTPHVSKFRHVPFNFSDDDRAQRYVDYIEVSGRSRVANVEAFFRATFDAWLDHRCSGHESIHVGYSPAITVDAARILTEMPQAHFLHIVRNPWSAYADTKKRPVPMPLEAYMLAWNTNQYHALLTQQRFGDRMHIVRTEDIMADPSAALTPLCRALGIPVHAALALPSWNGAPLTEIYPWGTIRSATVAANLATARELGPSETDRIGEMAWQYLKPLGYAEGF